MFTKELDILNLEWASYPSRDREISTPICNYLRYQGYSCLEGCVFRGSSLIRKWRPRVVYMSNLVGARVNIDVARTAKLSGAFVATGFSEGLAPRGKNDLEQLFWGNNTQHEKIETLQTAWSITQGQSYHTVNAAAVEHTIITGASGFDRFVWQGGEVRRTATVPGLIVGIGCWDFGPAFPADPRHEVFRRRVGLRGVEYFQRERDRFRQEIENLIRLSPPEVSFRIKPHPGTQLGDFASAVENLDTYQNVVAVSKNSPINEELVSSDLWVSYSSTTALEAWLIGKPTVILAPGGVDHPQSVGLHHGQPWFPAGRELAEALAEMKRTGIFPGFNELAPHRAQIIDERIGWADGLNHVRTGNELADLADSARTEGCKRRTVFMAPKALRNELRWRIVRAGRIHRRTSKSPISSVYIQRWDNVEIRAFAEMRMAQQIDFYNRHGLNKVDLRDMRGVSLASIIENQ